MGKNKYVPDDEEILLEDSHLIIRTHGGEGIAFHWADDPNKSLRGEPPHTVHRDQLGDLLELLDSGLNDQEDTVDSVPSPDDVLRDNADLYEQKNEDYGGSWRLAGKLFSMISDQCDADKLDPTDEQEMISVGLYFQRLHKLTRSANLELGSGNPNNEPLDESHKDESTYASMHAALAMERASLSNGGQNS